MQWIPNGPDIPNALLHAHEEGRVVFFCGAGISYPAGLPLFSGLVKQVSNKLSTQLNSYEQSLFNNNLFDSILDSLERRLPNGRMQVRQAIADVLKPKLRSRPNALDTHRAILTLGKLRTGQTRVVTTNVDQLFEQVIQKYKQKDNLCTHRFSAPLLPIPKQTQWDGLVYLHGLLPQPQKTASSDNELNKLIMTSGDFGRAYLTERWAARFVSELFRNYVVCFVGYSIGDTVLRYMMDALQADKRDGEQVQTHYAFADYQEGQREDIQDDWENKGVTPILYQHDNTHSLLHNTLKVWANAHRDGSDGKSQLIVQYTSAPPKKSTQQDDYVGRVLWALMDRSGEPAKTFAKEPTPDLAWLEVLDEYRFKHADLPAIGVHEPWQSGDEQLVFSLINRPTAYRMGTWMSLFGRHTHRAYDKPMQQIAEWLLHHLDKPELILWVTKKGGVSDWFAYGIKNKLNQTELEVKIKRYWELLLADQIALNRHPVFGFDLYDWIESVKRDGLSTTHRLTMRALLAPKIRLSQQWDWNPNSDNETAQPIKIQDDLGLASIHAYSHYDEIKGLMTAVNALDFLPEFQQLLLDGLDLWREVRNIDDKMDGSSWVLSSISEHEQNSRFHDWTMLVELIRDAWLLIYQDNKPLARELAHVWWEMRYPVFKRLALFSATYEGIADDGVWVDWLLVDNAYWLWAVDTKHEVMRVLVTRGHTLPDEKQALLEQALLAGVQDKKMLGKVDDQQWQMVLEREKWLKVVQYHSGFMGCSASVGADVTQYLQQIQQTYPNWQLATDERDEFGVWHSGVGMLDEIAIVDRVPRDRQQLVEWLRENGEKIEQIDFRADGWHQNDWQEVCRANPARAMTALYQLSIEGIYPKDAWCMALQVWCQDQWLPRSWFRLGCWLKKMPDETLQAVAHPLAMWLNAVAKKELKEQRKLQYADQFVVLCSRVIALNQSADDSNFSDDIWMGILNQPLGMSTQALVNYWFSTQPNDNDGLPKKMKDIFTLLCNSIETTSLAGRSFLANNAIALYRVDEAWTKEHLLPLFSWEASKSEASAMWSGFLYESRIYQPLIAVLKTDFLATATHYAQLNQNAQQRYASMLTYMAIDEMRYGLTVNEICAVIDALPSDGGLSFVVGQLEQQLHASNTERAAFCRNRVLPFWHKYWPKDAVKQTAETSQAWAQICIQSGNAFPEAFDTLKDYITPTEGSSLYSLILREDVGIKYPQKTLALLNKITADGLSWYSDKLDRCLTQISDNWVAAVSDSDFTRLKNLTERR